MALFRTITTSADLPNPGTGRETGTFDFKGSADPTNQRELAKDIAGFANSLGGVVLVGAVEDSTTGTLLRYNPMGTATAEALKRAYELANSQRCQPTPVVDVVRISLPSPASGDVVVVNVYPTPMGPVGVRWDSDKGGPSFAFPLRTATQTQFLTPTELAMLMVPELRRIAIALDSIPLEQRDKIFMVFTARVSGAQMVKLVSVESRLTAAEFLCPYERVAIPLDRIQSVWKQDDQLWIIAVDGWLETRLSRQVFMVG
jgi:hypothetical protein